MTTQIEVTSSALHGSKTLKVIPVVHVSTGTVGGVFARCLHLAASVHDVRPVCGGDCECGKLLMEIDGEPLPIDQMVEPDGKAVWVY